MKHSVVRFDVCADVHKDIMHDADQRLQVFIDEMNEANVDFIIELGDFMQPQAYNASFLDIWSSFDRERFHFIVLDGNDVKDPPQEGYARYMGKEQLSWLRQDLAGTGSRVIIFSHQSIEDPGGVENAAGVRRILEEANRQSGKKKVIACFSGHHHIDYATEINGIYYIQVNSMSYFWMGGDYLQVRYSREIDEQYPYIKYTAPYRDPIFATVEIDSRGTIRITGRESSWVGPDPWELGYPEEKRPVTGPRISSRELAF